MAQLRIGACSWKFPSWHGLVYSAAKGIDYLEEYAQRYDTVEVDQWFWSRFDLGEVRLPRPADVSAYRAAVTDDFRFTIKVPNSITLTHLYQKKKSDPLIANPSFLSSSLMSTFLESLGPLHDVIGPLVFQFEYLNQQKMSSQRAFQDRFAAFVAQIPRGYPYALEVRNPKYMNASYFEFLDQNHLFLVLVQGYWMPPVWTVYEEQRASILRLGTVVIRLMGPDRARIERLTDKQWHQIVAPKDQELEHVIGVVRDLLSEGVDVYINVNNHYEGSAPLTIERIKQLL